MPTKAELQARVEILEKENASLKGMLARAERELSGKLLPEELPPADIPDRVSVQVDEVFPCTVGGVLVLRPSQMV